MIRLTKKVEYALLSLQYMGIQDGKVCTAKEIAEQFNISFELLAKVLSILTRKSLIQSHQGVHGGFTLSAKPNATSIADIIYAVEGKRTNIVECGHDEDGQCYVESRCTIRNPLKQLQSRIDAAFSSMTIADLLLDETVVESQSLVQIELV